MNEDVECVGLGISVKKPFILQSLLVIRFSESQKSGNWVSPEGKRLTRVT